VYVCEDINCSQCAQIPTTSDVYNLGSAVSLRRVSSLFLLSERLCSGTVTSSLSGRVTVNVEWDFMQNLYLCLVSLITLGWLINVGQFREMKCWNLRLVKLLLSWQLSASRVHVPWCCQRVVRLKIRRKFPLQNEVVWSRSTLVLGLPSAAVNVLATPRTEVR
jgi:hypothetical protein